LQLAGMPTSLAAVDVQHYRAVVSMVTFSYGQA
jgi:hypothetical protein